MLPNDDGSVWVVAYGSNELVRFDVNGIVLDRVRGPLEGLDRPVDIIRLRNGNLLVTESARDCLTLFDRKGSYIKHIGKKGRGEGELIGPQYIAEDSYGNIYVTDFGNNRVVVFDPDGEPLLHFGEKSASFEGLRSPTGIAVLDDRVFVADSVKGTIFEFDRSGNYMGLLVEKKTLVRPESLKTWGSYLILADMNRVLTIDTSNGAMYENATTGKASSCITSAVSDRNGNIAYARTSAFVQSGEFEKVVTSLMGDDYSGKQIASYTFYVMDDEKQMVPGMQIHLSSDTVDETLTTGEDGMASYFTEAAQDLKVEVLNLPEGYTSNADEIRVGMDSGVKVITIGKSK